MLSRLISCATALFFIMMSSDAVFSQTHPLPFDQPPAWAREAIWYQIFVERFRNGNQANNPTLETCSKALFDKMPDDWQLTPWGHNWYQQEAWAKNTGLDFYRTIQMRRYGGDLAGVEEKIPYLKELGITAIYFNPLNDAPSLHKYDARYYHHIDVTFGDDAKEDMALMASENPADPSTWKWTSADLRFLSLIKLLHSQGIRVVLDFSWNHTGNDFWAFRDIQKNKSASPFKDWYHTSFYTDSITGKEEFTYEGWIGIKSLPELRKVDTHGKIQGHPYEGNMHASVKQHIFDVCRRWMDPNGDGNTDDGIDGMRLDVAEHVPMGFWREFRQYVRSVNPSFYLIGENWWTQWPDVLMDPAPWVKGDVFDAVMHYQWFKVARGYFAQSDDGLSLTQFRTKIDSVFLKYPEYTRQAMMNLASSHDSPRLLTSFQNTEKYKYNCKPQENAQYRTGKVDTLTMNKIHLFLLHQFTFVGAPHIWNGDEMGMTGADDPDNRKPLLWPDLAFDAETPSSLSAFSYEEIPAFDDKLYSFYRSLIQLRKSDVAFSQGTYEFLVFPDDDILAYKRTFEGREFLVLFNANPVQATCNLPLSYKGSETVFEVGQTERKMKGETLFFQPYSAVVLRKN